MVERIQHRGMDSEINPTLPNSFESFRERFKQSIELDVFLLRDGNIAVLHNKDLNMTHEQVEAMDLAEMEKIIIPNKKDGKDGHIPLFEEFALSCLDRGNGLIVDIKGSSPEMAKKLSRKLIELICRMSKEDETFSRHPEYIKQIKLYSFSIEALEEAKIVQKEDDIQFSLGLCWPSTFEHAKETRISETAIERSGFKEGDDWIQKGIEMTQKLGARLISIHWSAINEEVIKKAHERGIQIGAGIVNDEEKAKKLEEMGVDEIITEN